MQVNNRSLITTRAQFRELWVSPFSTKIIRGSLSSTLTPNRHVLMLTAKGTIYFSGMQSSKRMRVRNLPGWSHGDLATGLIRLGLASPGLLTDIDRHTKLRERARLASDLLSYTPLLEELGTPFSELQYAALDAVRNTPGEDP